LGFEFFEFVYVEVVAPFSVGDKGSEVFLVANDDVLFVLERVGVFRRDKGVTGIDDLVVEPVFTDFFSECGLRDRKHLGGHSIILGSGNLGNVGGCGDGIDFLFPPAEEVNDTCELADSRCPHEFLVVVEFTTIEKFVDELFRGFAFEFVFRFVPFEIDLYEVTGGKVLIGDKGLFGNEGREVFGDNDVRLPFVFLGCTVSVDYRETLFVNVLNVTVVAMGNAQFGIELIE